MCATFRKGHNVIKVPAAARINPSFTDTALPFVSSEHDIPVDVFDKGPTLRRSAFLLSSPTNRETPIWMCRRPRLMYSSIPLTIRITPGFR
jgi:hypothetical protein